MRFLFACDKAQRKTWRLVIILSHRVALCDRRASMDSWWIRSHIPQVPPCEKRPKRKWTLKSGRSTHTSLFHMKTLCAIISTIIITGPPPLGWHHHININMRAGAWVESRTRRREHQIQLEDGIFKPACIHQAHNGCLWRCCGVF